MTRRDWISISALGFTGYYVGSYLDFAGLQYISAGLGRLILYLYPTLVLLLSALFLKQPIRARHLASLGLSYGGIALVFQHEASFGDNLSLTLLGATLVFAGAVSYAIYLIGGSRIVQQLGSMRFTAYASISASCFVIAHFMITHGPAQLAVGIQDTGDRPADGNRIDGAALWLMAEGLKRIGANQASLVACIGPISTIALAHFFLGEPVTGYQMAGAALVLAGVMIISVKNRKQVRKKISKPCHLCARRCGYRLRSCTCDVVVGISHRVAGRAVADFEIYGIYSRAVDETMRVGAACGKPRRHARAHYLLARVGDTSTSLPRRTQTNSSSSECQWRSADAAPGLIVVRLTPKCVSPQRVADALLGAPKTRGLNCSG